MSVRSSSRTSPISPRLSSRNRTSARAGAVLAMVMLDLAINKDLRKGPFVEANEITQLANDIANQ